MISHNKAVEKALTKASAMGCMVFRNEVGLFMDMRGNPRKIGVKGRPDIGGISNIRGRGIDIEVKTGAAVRSKEQVRYGNRCMELGGIYVVARYDDERGLNGDDDIEKAINEARSEYESALEAV